MKTTNHTEILNFASGAQNSIRGQKLAGLFRLIQAKGKPMETDDEKLNGVKVLNIDNGFYFGLIRTGAKDKFYPCVIKSILLTTNN
jgi:hypothetical protein